MSSTLALPTRPSRLQVPGIAPADAYWERSTTSGLYVPRGATRRCSYDRPTGLDLFCGCGGFSCGFMRAGFHVVAAVDHDADAAVTYMVNLCRWGELTIHYIEPEDQARLEKAVAGEHKRRGTKNGRADFPYLKDWEEAGLVRGFHAGSGMIAHEDDMPGVNHFFLGDIRKLSGARILEAVGLEVGELSCIFGGPPCQGFSTQGRRNVMDPRNSLVFEFTRLVNEIKPHTMVFENVPGILSMVTEEGIPVVDAICMDLEKGGYGTREALRKALTGESGKGAKAAARRQRAAERPESATDTAAPETAQKKAPPVGARSTQLSLLDELEAA